MVSSLICQFTFNMDNNKIVVVFVKTVPGSWFVYNSRVPAAYRPGLACRLQSQIAGDYSFAFISARSDNMGLLVVCHILNRLFNALIGFKNNSSLTNSRQQRRLSVFCYECSESNPGPVRLQSPDSGLRNF